MEHAIGSLWPSRLSVSMSFYSFWEMLEFREVKVSLEENMDKEWLKEDLKSDSGLIYCLGESK